jgi:hypothetical protein
MARMEQVLHSTRLTAYTERSDILGKGEPPAISETPPLATYICSFLGFLVSALERSLPLCLLC